MRRGLLSFVIAAFVTLALFFFASTAINLRDYQAMNQNRLTSQILSQRYYDVTAAYDDAFIDAIRDSAFNSTYGSLTCLGVAPTMTFDTVLNAKLKGYYDNVTSRFDNDGIQVAYRTNPANFLIDTIQADTTGSTCDNIAGTVMKNVTVETTIYVTVADPSNTTGYFNETFYRKYSMYANMSSPTNPTPAFNVKIMGNSGPTMVNCVRVIC